MCILVHQATNGDCGNASIAVFFMVSFILIAFLIIINMYIAVILENFNQAHQQEEVGVTEDDFDMFYVTWEKYDPHASQFVKYDFIFIYFILFFFFSYFYDLQASQFIK